MPVVTTWEGTVIRLPEGLDSKATLNRLLRATEGLGFTAFRVKGGQLHAGEVVGSVQVGRLRINILPKTDSTVELRDKRFLTNLLVAGGYVERPHATPAAVRAAASDPMEMVILHAASTINRALSYGIPRRYETASEEAPTLRGRLDITRLATRAGHAELNIPVRHFPLSLENQLSRCIKGISQLLYAAAKTVVCRQILAVILHRMSSIRSAPVRLADLNALELASTEQNWTATIRLASLLLVGKSPDPTFSGGNLAFSLLFPPQHLFERAMRNVITSAGTMLGMETSHRAHSKFLYEEVPSGRGILSLRPDFIFSKYGLPSVVADAKWKRLSSVGRGLGVERQDLYQLSAYQSRYGASHGLMFFPKAHGLSSGLIARLRSPVGTEIVCIVGVDIESLVSGVSLVRTRAVEQFAEDIDGILAAGS